jgi:rhamnogalacturonan endolyase
MWIRLVTLWLVAFSLAMPAASGDGFVLLPGGTFLSSRGQAKTRVEAFEILDHAITNQEYKAFIDTTGYAAPPHWAGGRIPAGMERHPVIFVNRYDVDAYLKWRSRAEKRVYRLPTAAEFEYAARGGLEGKKYPWGDEDPKGRANFDADGSRSAPEWRRLLQPVKSYAPNGYGLFDMAGNVWQMVLTFPDASRQQYKYRVENPTEIESSVAGGSWLRGAPYMRCGSAGGLGAGMRLADLGFRIVREVPESASLFPQPRRLVALPQGDGRVFLSWQLLASDPPDVAFHVYASRRRDAPGDRVTRQPLAGGTNFVDQARGSLVYYRVRPVVQGREGTPSEWAGVEPGAAATRAVMVIKPTARQGGIVPVFGDLDGDGRPDVVVRLDNGIREMSRDPGVPVELEAFNYDGHQLWRRPLVWHDHCFGNANNVPVVVYDLDGDGRAEVIARVQEGDAVYLAVLNGMNGRVLRKAAWPKMASDFAKTSTRIHLAVAYLDGKHPSLITQTGLYENEIITAWDANLKKLWEFRSEMETSGSGSHHIDVADVDGDGRDEVFDGTTCLNPDGTVRWSIYRQHPDIVAIKHILPEPAGAARASRYAGRQVYYAVESSVHAGAYLVDANTGKLIWKLNREDDPRWVHAHIGWASDIWDGSPGMEMLTNRDGHAAEDTVLFSAEGKILMNPFPRGWRPVNWEGNATRELLTGDGKRLGKFNGCEIVPVPGAAPNEGKGSCSMVADLVGDYRDEVVCIGPAEDGGQAIYVYTNTAPLDRRAVTRAADREYRLWLARNWSGGYASYFEPE